MRTLFLVTAVLLSLSCFQVKEALHFRRDGTGTFSMTITYNTETLLEYFQKIYRPQQVQEIRGELEREARTKEFYHKLRKRLTEKLPRGFQLKSFTFRPKGPRWTYHIEVAFSDFRQLKKLDFAPLVEDLDVLNFLYPFFDPFSPFGKLKLHSPQPEVWQLYLYFSPGIGLKDLELEEEHLANYRNMELSFSLQMEYPVRKHNAQRVQGKNYFWRFDLKKLQEFHRRKKRPHLFIEFLGPEDRGEGR